jgi:putative Holliday junction resolvase
LNTLLGFDFGPRKIGVAVGQRLTGSATPLMTVPAWQQRAKWQAIERLITEWQPEEAVVGLPYNMDDTEESWCHQVRRFGRQLEGRFHLRVHFIDERLTTYEARTHLNRRAAQRGLLDAVAAQLILETWLREQS